MINITIVNKLILSVGEPALVDFFGWVLSLRDVEWGLWSSTIRIFAAIADSVSHFSVDVSGLVFLISIFDCNVYINISLIDTNNLSKIKFF